MNVYPEDLESALRKQPGVRDCVVIGLDRGGNAESCAALLLDQGADGTDVMKRVNASLAEYQQIRRWFAWPDPDFPRSATHKPLLPRIREVAAAILAAHVSAQAAQSDTSFNELIAKLTARCVGTVSANASLETQLNLSSLDRVELMSALESKYQVDLSEVKFADASTVSQLEQLVRRSQPAVAPHVFPRWSQNAVVTFVRLAIYYALTWPATYLLAAPRVEGRENLRDIRGPVVVIANHVTYLDIGWILAALPARFRHRLATAMDGERLTGMRHSPYSANLLTKLLNRLNYFLVVTLFNVFPLPKLSGFLKSFNFAGDLLDRGWNVLIFPEGVTTDDGTLAPFRSGIGLLATRLDVPVLPIKLDGLFELKQNHRILARRGQVRVTIGKPVRFSVDQNPDEIAKELQRRVAEL
jgi:long-chain acyl-CoA synthetase